MTPKGSPRRERHHVRRAGGSPGAPPPAFLVAEGHRDQLFRRQRPSDLGFSRAHLHLDAGESNCLSLIHSIRGLTPGMSVQLGNDMEAPRQPAFVLRVRAHVLLDPRVEEELLIDCGHTSYAPGHRAEHSYQQLIRPDQLDQRAAITPHRPLSAARTPRPRSGGSAVSSMTSRAFPSATCPAGDTARKTGGDTVPPVFSCARGRDGGLRRGSAARSRPPPLRGSGGAGTPGSWRTAPTST